MSEEKANTAVATAGAPASSHGSEAPRRKFGSSNNFSSDSMPSRAGNRSRRGRGGGRGSRRNDRSADNKLFEEQTIAIDRVSRTVKGGRRLRFKALVVVGDRKAKVGVGVAKGRDVQQAIEKATNVARKRMISIPLTNKTIPHEIELKSGATRVLLRPAMPGTGIIAGGVIRTIIGTTGINNLVTKSLGSTNKVNIAYTTIKALSQLKPRSEWVGVKQPVASEEVK